MNFRTLVSLLGVVTFFAGCAATSQPYVPLDKAMLNGKAGRVGVAMTTLPTPDTRFPGADCLLCAATASMMNSSLTSHTKKLPPEGLDALKGRLAEMLKSKGTDAVVVADGVDLKSLPDFATKGPNVALKDFTALKGKLSVDKLLLVDVNRLGIYRQYSSYVPSSDPIAEFGFKGYLVNLNNNTYEWYQAFLETKGSEGKWDEPPDFPGPTNAYFQVLEVGKDSLLNAFQ